MTLTNVRCTRYLCSSMISNTTSENLKLPGSYNSSLVTSKVTFSMNSSLGKGIEYPRTSLWVSHITYRIISTAITRKLFMLFESIHPLTPQGHRESTAAWAQAVEVMFPGASDRFHASSCASVLKYPRVHASPSGVVEKFQFLGRNSGFTLGGLALPDSQHTAFRILFCLLHEILENRHTVIRTFSKLLKLVVATSEQGTRTDPKTEKTFSNSLTCPACNENIPLCRFCQQGKPKKRNITLISLTVGPSILVSKCFVTWVNWGSSV